jgi:oligoribonuclease NrnB/cAMP/cGMP phosphodiesterase (DHH superfamily)
VFLMSVKVFYHSKDLDGFCSGAIVKHKFPEAEMFPINYGDKFPWDEIKPHDVVYMVDFSLPIEEMDRLNDYLQQNLVWIDHHIGIIREYEDTPIRFLPILGKRDTSVSACELAWKNIFPKTKLPLFIRLLSLYDTWNHNDDTFDFEFIERFQYGFKARSRDPKEDMQFWEDWFTTAIMSTEDQLSLVNSVSNDGKLIQSYIEDRFETTLKDRSNKIDWEGYKCLVVNSDPYIANYMSRSNQFHDCEVAINYANIRGESWEVSLRTLRDDIDLSVLAKKYRGGGHQASAGFNWKSWILPWDLEIG